MKKKKLELKKKVIASLSDVQKAKIMGGDDAAYTTSFTNCTHFICCGDTCSVEPTNCDATCNVSCAQGPCLTDRDVCQTDGCPNTVQTNCNQMTCNC